MQPINKQDVLIRLLKDGHISDEEFKALGKDYKPIKPDSIAEYYMTVGKLDEMKAKVKAFENGFGSTIFPSGEAIARLIKEPLPLKKRELNRSIQWSGKDGELTSLVAKIAKQHQSQGRRGSILPSGFIQRKKDEKHPLFEDVPETTIPQGMHPKTWAFLNKHKN